MKGKSIILLTIILLVFLRAYFESILIQLGLNNEEYNYLFKSGLSLDFLKFKYYCFLNILSFVAFFLLAKYFFKNNIKKGLIKSLSFVLIFMFTDLYKIIGSIFRQIIPDNLMNKSEIDSSLYWSVELFPGMLVSVMIMVCFSELIKNRNITRVINHTGDQQNRKDKAQ